MALWERKVKIFVGVIAALAMGLGACGDDDSNGDKIRAQPGQLSAPTSLFFDQVPINEQDTKTIQITNVGEGTLRLLSIKLHEKSGGQYDGQAELFEAEGFSGGTIELSRGESHPLKIRYAPENQTADSGTIAIESNDPSLSGDYQIPVDTAGLRPQIYTTPDVITFDRVAPQPDDEDWYGEDKFLTVQNTGAAPLHVGNIYVSGSDRFSIAVVPNPQEPVRADDTDEWPEQLAPEERFTLRVTFTPEDDLPENAELVLESNDPQTPEVVVPLSGNSGAPCLRVSPGDEIAFGQGSLGQTSQKTVTLENCSRGAELEISDVSITDDGGGVFAIQDGSLPGSLPADPTIIAPGERSNFVVTFVPEQEQDYSGELYVASNDPANEEKTVPISGEGSNNACPTADAKGWLQGGSYRGDTIETIPLNTIQFDGGDSSDPDPGGGIDRFEWTILSRPQGSTQRLTPGNNVERPKLFLDLAGTYEVELKVYDNEGAASCGEPAIITIIAEPDDDVHIQLVWDTPSDPNPTDTFGTDLDLHYLHPNGRWNEPPWDVFWRNSTADWGPSGRAGDPSLDIDDTDGAGPENINHSDLENVRYRTGVYYYSDSTLGASYATIRIYIRGRLELEIENKYMPGTGSFWDVASIDGRTFDLLNISRMYQGFP